MAEQLTPEKIKAIRREIAEMREEHVGCRHEGCEWGRFLAYIEALEQELAQAQKEKGLFQFGDFTLHSGQRTDWKIDCDALTDSDIETLAKIISQRFRFSRVEGVSTGGLRLAKALENYCSLRERLLIVDDVLTTGASMEKQRAGREATGVVIFARGDCPAWVTALFQASEVLE